MGKFQESLGINELTKQKGGIWKALLAEFIGTLLLNFFGCASCITVKTLPTYYNFVLVGLTFGFTVFIVVQALGHISGGHVNPAVTAGMLATGNIPIIKGLLYIVVQCLGALAGSAILKSVTPEAVQAGLGKTSLSSGVTEPQAIGIEFMLGFVLVLTVFGVCDQNRPESKPIAALAIGMAVTLGHLAVVDYTGSSMNPARSFGAALITGDWECHWVYWIGPILGGIAAALLYKHAFAAPSMGPVRIVERYTTVVADEKELKRLDGAKIEEP